MKLRVFRFETAIVYRIFFMLIHEMIINVRCYDVEQLHPMEKEHNPVRFIAELDRAANGTLLPPTEHTPDYRVEEPPFLVRQPLYTYTFHESQRPYRLSPHYKQAKRFDSYQRHDRIARVGAYCTTVYKKLTLLAGCVVLTHRHILTTATSTQVVLSKYNLKKPGVSLANILGVWYDNNQNVYNSSMYVNIARIHYHPKYIRPHEVNITHPIPCVFDLAVWATTISIKSAILCERAASGSFTYEPGLPKRGYINLVVGFQFVKAVKKKPMPWFKYVVRTMSYVNCPKANEWGWFACIEGELWSKYGLDSGAALHRALHGSWSAYDGLVGINAFSARLRSEKIIHYFTVLDCYPVLDFMYDAYNGYIKNEYLDPRFSDTKGYAPVAKVFIDEKETELDEKYSSYILPYY